MSQKKLQQQAQKKATKKAVLLVNLGTPEKPDAKSVRRFLKQFLWDPRVVEVPRPIWWMILNLFILPFRPRPVAKNYKGLWDEYGDSPLRLFSLSQQKKLQDYFTNQQADVHVELAMTYGEPSIANRLQFLQQQGFSEILVLPLYPQYSATTTAAVYDQVADYQKAQRELLDIKFCNFYFDQPSWKNALLNSVNKFWQENGRADMLVLSFHGIPKRNVDLGDPYYQHCKQTTQQLVDSLQLHEAQYVMCFQSRLGKAEWLKPYATETLKQLAAKGVKSVDVICPSFSVDCLETLEEIAIENAEEFVEAGGESLRLIPALNDSDEHIAALAAISAAYLALELPEVTQLHNNLAAMPTEPEQLETTSVKTEQAGEQHGA